MRNIVILGGGFGGLTAAKIISKKLKRFGLNKEYVVTVADKNFYHTYTPLLYETATAAKETANYAELQKMVTFSFKDSLGEKTTLIQDEVIKIEPEKGKVRLKKHELTYDYLIIALGTENNFFNIPGTKKYAYTLKTFMDALRLRDAILNAASENKSPKIVIGGGGSTGVEMAGEIKNWIPQARVSILEASESILRGFLPKVIAKTKERLERLGVEIMFSERITSINEKSVVLANGKKVDYDIFIWGGGAKAQKVIAELPLKIEMGGRGRIESSEKMECLPQAPDMAIRGKIYAIGDNVCTKAPAVARAAIDHAKVAAANIVADILNKEKGAPLRHYAYEPREYPYVIPVGGKYAIVKIGQFVISGFFGWIIKGLVEFNYLVSILPFGRALRIWFRGLKIFIQNDRLG